MKLVVERARPEEVLGTHVQLSHGRHWAELASFPSGHMIVTAALAGAAATVFPRLRTPLFAYVGLVALTRVMFGAHFPLDVVAGVTLGYGSALAVPSVLAQAARGADALRSRA